jgi:hypothetical protein
LLVLRNLEIGAYSGCSRIGRPPEKSLDDVESKRHEDLELGKAKLGLSRDGQTSRPARAR